MKRKSVFLLLLLIIPFFFSPKDTAIFTLTGNTSQEDVEWKNPYLPLEKKTLTTYEVKLTLPSGKEFQTFLFGEIVGIRYRLLELYPFFHFMGWKDKLVFDCLNSDYLDLEKKKNLPTKFLALEQIESSFWKKLFFERLSFLWIRKASLKTEYLPLVDSKRSYLISFKKGSLNITELTSQDLPLFQGGS